MSLVEFKLLFYCKKIRYLRASLQHSSDNLSLWFFFCMSGILRIKHKYYWIQHKWYRSSKIPTGTLKIYAQELAVPLIKLFQCNYIPASTWQCGKFFISYGPVAFVLCVRGRHCIHQTCSVLHRAPGLCLVERHPVYHCSNGACGLAIWVSDLWRPSMCWW